MSEGNSMAPGGGADAVKAAPGVCLTATNRVSLSRITGEKFGFFYRVLPKRLVKVQMIFQLRNYLQVKKSYIMLIETKSSTEL